MLKFETTGFVPTAFEIEPAGGIDIGCPMWAKKDSNDVRYHLPSL